MMFQEDCDKCDGTGQDLWEGICYKCEGAGEILTETGKNYKLSFLGIMV